VTGDKPGKVLSNRAIALSAGAVVLLAIVGAWVLLGLFGGGSVEDRARIEVIRTVGTIVLGAGGALALLLAARRQQTAEQDLAHKERVQRHAEQIAAAGQDDALERRITDMYTAAIAQLGSDKAAVRIGGLYALERVAQTNPSQRQTIVNVLCAYLRMPYEPPGEPPSDDAGEQARLAHRERQQEHEARIVSQRILKAHLDPGTADDPPDTFWVDIDLDLTGATLLDGGFLARSRVREVNFERARFLEYMTFHRTVFQGHVFLAGAEFTRPVTFEETRFEKYAQFRATAFLDEAFFLNAMFLDDVDFERARFAAKASLAQIGCDGDAIFFTDTTFDGESYFDHAMLLGMAHFTRTRFRGPARFWSTRFENRTFLEDAVFDQEADFKGAQFGPLNLTGSRFHGPVSFAEAEFREPPDLGTARFDHGVPDLLTRPAPEIYEF
jgi:uncharacterized protein YjbI with pentapeptide repeats